jgi:O-antigen/teichoic acid export membrane protein
LIRQSIQNLLTDVVGVITSRERLRQLWGISFYSNAFYIMLASGLTSLLNFVFWIIVARFYTAADVGLASAVLAGIGLLSAIAHLGLGLSIRFLPQAGEDANPLINTAFTLGTIATVLSVAIFIIGLGVWSPALMFIRQNPVYLTAFIIFTIASVLGSLVGETFMAKRRAGFLVAQNLILTISRLPLPIIMAGFLHSFGIVSSWGISLLLSLVISALIFLPKVQPGYRPSLSIKRKIVIGIAQYSFINYISNFLWGLPAMMIPIMVLNMLGAESAAFFYIAWAIANAFTLISNALSLSVFAEGSYEEDQLWVSLRRSLKISFFTFLPAAAVLLAAANIILLIFGNQYADNSSTLLRIMSVSLLPMGINSIYLSILRVQKKLKIILGISVIAAGGTLGIAYLLLPGMGVNGIGVAWLIVQGAISVFVVANWIKCGQLFAKRH